MFQTVFSNDLILRKARTLGCRPSWEMIDQGPNFTAPYDIVIVDEAQDLNSDLLWGLVTLLRNPNGQCPDLLILGDKRQAIFEYRGSDSRYLDYASQTFPTNTGRSWTSMTLDRSVRLSLPSATFINTFTGESTIKAFKSGPLPTYFVVDPDNRVEELADKLAAIIKAQQRKLIDEGDNDEKKWSDVAIIAPYIPGNHILATIANTLSDRGFYLSRLGDDDASRDPKVLEGKIVIGSYHRFKGIESNLVVVLGVDSSLLHGEEYLDGCPNELLVALTRAEQKIVTVQSDKEEPMPGLDPDALRERAEVVLLTDKWPREPKEKQKNNRTKPVTVPRLVRHLPVDILEQAIGQGDIRIVEVEPPSARLHIPTIVQCGPYHEAVGDLNGLAIMAAFEWEVARTCKSLKLEIFDVPQSLKGKARYFAKRATFDEGRSSMHRYRHKQLKLHTSFSWLEDVYNSAMTRLGNLFPSVSELNFGHQFVEKGIEIQGKKFNVRGSAHVTEPPLGEGQQSTIYDIKVKSHISPDDVVQLVLYGRLWTSEKRQSEPSTLFPRLVLFNVTDNHKIEVCTTYKEADELLQKVLKARYLDKPSAQSTDEEFLEACRSVHKEVEEARDIATLKESKNGENPLNTWFTM